MHYLLKDFSQNKGKFSPNAKKSIFLGFNQNTQCYIIMDYEDHKLHHVREILFIIYYLLFNYSIIIYLIIQLLFI